MTEYNSHSKEPQEAPIKVPIDALSPEALLGVVHEFIQREGTDYGHSEVSLETKTEQILKQLKSGYAELYFDASTESVTLVRKK
ncbi:MAG: YheU family protein [Bdellovibrionales bacterium]